MDIFERILRSNPWWEGAGVEGIKGFKKRDMFEHLLKFMDLPQCVVITGLRRVGKTTLLFQLIELLLKQGIDKKQVLYFSFDELLAKDPDIIERVLDLYEKEILRKELSQVYIFLDEINHIRNWQIIIKRFYDLSKGIKFVVTGSSSVFLKKSKESLAGRVYEFELNPLNFREYLSIKGIKIADWRVQSLVLKRELNRFLLNGGLPEIVDKTDFEIIHKYTKGVVEKIIFHDIPIVYDVGNPEVLNEVFSIIAKTPGNIIEYGKIASMLGVSYQTISKYIRYLEKAYLVRILYNYRGSPLTTARKSKKIYPIAPTLSSAVLPSERDFFLVLPKLIENSVVTALDARYFFREYYEVDILYKELPVEVKYGDRFDIKGAIKTARKLKSGYLTVITRDRDGSEEIEGLKVNFIPLWKFLYFPEIIEG